MTIYTTPSGRATGNAQAAIIAALLERKRVSLKVWRWK